MYSYNNLINISNSNLSELCEIMNRNLSDKGNGWHNYTKLYNELFKHRRHEKLNILEIGIGSIDPSIPSNMTGGELGLHYKPGASVRGWYEYFPNSEIYCCDIDRTILDFEQERIHGFYLDQTNNNVIEDVINNGIIKDIKFDIIIDDGLHFFPVNCNLMTRLINKVKKGGYYIIEDIKHTEYNYRYIDFNILNSKNYQYIRLPNDKNNVDNNLFIVEC